MPSQCILCPLHHTISLQAYIGQEPSHSASTTLPELCWSGEEGAKSSESITAAIMSCCTVKFVPLPIERKASGDPLKDLSSRRFHSKLTLSAGLPMVAVGRLRLPTAGMEHLSSTSGAAGARVEQSTCTENRSRIDARSTNIESDTELDENTEGFGNGGCVLVGVGRLELPASTSRT